MRKATLMSAVWGEERAGKMGFFPPSFLSNQVKAIKESLPTENYTPKLNISTVFGSLAVWLVQVDAG